MNVCGDCASRVEAAAVPISVPRPVAETDVKSGFRLTARMWIIALLFVAELGYAASLMAGDLFKQRSRDQSPSGFKALATAMAQSPNTGTGATQVPSDWNALKSDGGCQLSVPPNWQIHNASEGANLRVANLGRTLVANIRTTHGTLNDSRADLKRNPLPGQSVIKDTATRVLVTYKPLGGGKAWLAFVQASSGTVCEGTVFFDPANQALALQIINSIRSAE